eukprot:4186538-Pyramimonas_sp.AAC.1
MVAHDGTEARALLYLKLTSRVSFCRDMFELRINKAIRMRMSLSRDTDHFTALLRSDSERHCGEARRVESRRARLHALLIPVYALRTAMSENSRSIWAHESTVPVGCTIRARHEQRIILLLSAATCTLHVPVFSPCGRRADRGN